MQPWNCCRTCLNTNFLNPIFYIADQNKKYSEILLGATGVKIDHQDNLPQSICTDCVNLINKIIKFRTNCMKTQNVLLEKLNNKQFQVIKNEIEGTKSEFVTIDLNDSHFDNYFYDDNDDIPLINEIKHRIDDKTNAINNKNLRTSKRKTSIIKKRVKNKNIENDTPNNIDDCARETKDTDLNEERKGQVQCEYCHKILTSRLSLRNHYKIHTGFDVVCEHCGKKFITRRLLLMHCRAKHGYEKTDKCSYCDYKASNAEQVKIHERLHTGEKPYKCKDCAADFHRKSSFLQHIAIHLPEKTVQCDQCPARFKSVTLMRIHKNRHRQTRYSFKCYICQSDFARRRNVIRHLHRIHAVSAPNVTDIERVKVA